jgi:hypothetical protein
MQTDPTAPRPWAPCPEHAKGQFTPETLTARWPELHAGDGEPLPGSQALLAGWLLYHNGEFEAAARAGLALGAEGATLACKATCIYASYLEPSEERRLALLQQMATLARDQQALAPENANTHYWQAYALGRYSQGISVAKALSIGLGRSMKGALQRCLALAPDHVDAHLALGHYHAEVIDKVGELIGGMTHGASKSAGMALYDRALALSPHSAITRCEAAQGWVMLEGTRALERARALRESAWALEARDAMERIYLGAARAELQDS